MSLFDSSTPPADERPDKKRPLAERMRPERLEDYIGAGAHPRPEASLSGSKSNGMSSRRSFCGDLRVSARRLSRR